MRGVTGSRNTADATRRHLLDAVLAHVPFDGWTDRAVKAGARDCGIELLAAQRAFPRGAADVLDFWNGEADRRMLDALARLDLDATRVRDRITAAVRVRIEPYRDHREAVRLALCRASLPQNAGAAMGALYRTVDAMWRAAGDTATDYNFYTKRGLLAGVYASTLLYWLEDTSAGAAATWAFLDRRIADVMKVPRAVDRVKNCLPDPERLMRAAFSRRPARG